MYYTKCVQPDHDLVIRPKHVAPSNTYCILRCVDCYCCSCCQRITSHRRPIPL